MWIYSGDKWVRKVMLGKKMLRKVMFNGELIWEYDPYVPKYYYWYNSLNNSTNTSSMGYQNKIFRVNGDPTVEPGTQTKLTTPTSEYYFGSYSGNIGIISGVVNSGVTNYTVNTPFYYQWASNINFNITFNALDPMKEYTFLFTGNEDEGTGSYGNIRIYFNNVAYTPKKAIEMKLIKPIFLMTSHADGGSINLQTLLDGNQQNIGKDSNGDYVHTFQFCFQTNKGATLTRLTFIAPGERGTYYLWESNQGRIIFDDNSSKTETTVYKNSQYKERYW